MRDYSYACETCGAQCTKRISPAREGNPPRFCSNACKFKAMVHPSPVRQHACSFCGGTFTRYVSVERQRHAVLYCDKSCAAKASRAKRGHRLRSVASYACKECGLQFQRLERANGKPYEYCTKRCASRHAVRCGLNGFSSFERLEAAGKDSTVELLRAIRSNAAIDSNTDRVPSLETRQKISASCTGIPNALKGKTFEEFYGPERGKQLAERHSHALLDGYASGRLSPSPASSSRDYVRGTYKGMPFKSSYEYAFMKLKEAEGHVLGTDVVYEPADLRVSYQLDGKHRTYFPDFYVAAEATVYEVKPKLSLCQPEVVAKCQAAHRQFAAAGLQYRFVTEDDLGRRLSRREVYADDDVVPAP